MSKLKNDSAARAEVCLACVGATKQRGAPSSRFGTSIEEMNQ